MLHVTTFDMAAGCNSEHFFCITKSYQVKNETTHSAVPLPWLWTAFRIPFGSSANVGLLQQMCNTFWLQVDCWWSSCITLLLITVGCPVGSSQIWPWLSVTPIFLEPFMTLLLPFPMSLLLFSCLSQFSAPLIFCTIPDCTACKRCCSWNAGGKGIKISKYGGFHVGRLSWLNWNLEVLVFCGGRKSGETKDKPSKARREPPTNSNHYMYMHVLCFHFFPRCLEMRWNIVYMKNYLLFVANYTAFMKMTKFKICQPIS